jgi:hypothetical protein
MSVAHKCIQSDQSVYAIELISMKKVDKACAEEFATHLLAGLFVM